MNDDIEMLRRRLTPIWALERQVPYWSPELDALNRLETEIKRLRAALEDMLGDDDVDPYIFEHMSDMERYVRNALAEREEK
jgi:hypothetical protein